MPAITPEMTLEDLRAAIATYMLSHGVAAPVSDDKREAERNIRGVLREWLEAGLPLAAVARRLNDLLARLAPPSSSDGSAEVMPRGRRFWHLDRPAEARLLEWIEQRARAAESREGCLMRRKLAALIRWSTRTGLRPEASLKLRWQHVFPGESLDGWSVRLRPFEEPLPLSPDAAAVLQDGVPGSRRVPGALIFGLDAATLAALWDECRAYLGVAQDPASSVRSLRRSAARHLHVEQGMPIGAVRQYLDRAGGYPEPARA